MKQREEELDKRHAEMQELYPKQGEWKTYTTLCERRHIQVQHLPQEEAGELDAAAKD